MIKSIRKHAKRRLGLTPQKVVFTIEVRNIKNLLPALAHLEKDAVLSVCFERGGKMSCSTGISFDPTATGTTGTLDINQKLALVATLYQETSGSFQEKTAKLILRQLKTSRLLGNVYKGLGVVSLKLNVLMQDLLTETSKSVSYPMEVLKGGAVISITVSARLLAFADDGGDDAGSLLSDSSDISMMCAAFDPEELAASSTTTSMTATNVIPSSQSSFFASSSSRASIGTYTFRRPSMSALHEGDEEGDGAEEDEQQVEDEVSMGTSNEFVPEALTSSGQEKLNSSVHVAEDKVSPSSRDSDHPNSLFAGDESGKGNADGIHSERYGGGPTSTASMLSLLKPRQRAQSSSSTPRSPSTERSSSLDAKDDADNNPYTLLKKMGVVFAPRKPLEELELIARVGALEKQVASRDRYIASLQGEFYMELSAFKDEITTVREDATIVRLELKRERTAREALQTGYVNEDNFLTSFLATAEKELQSVTAEYAQCCAELQNVQQDLGLARIEVERAATLREDERHASIEAATVAAAASLRRAELEAEMDDMIHLLVDSKVLSADLALQLEEEKKKNHVLRRRMQKYAEKMGAMELAAVIEGLRRKDEIGSSNS